MGNNSSIGITNDDNSAMVTSRTETRENAAVQIVDASQTSRSGADDEIEAKISNEPLQEDAEVASLRYRQADKKIASEKDRSSLNPFPVQLHCFLLDASKTNNCLAKWVDNESSFCIDRKHNDLPMLLERHFGCNKYRSLRRQLNLYGFKLNDHGNFQRCGRHPFKRSSTRAELIQIKPRPTRARTNECSNMDIVLQDKEKAEISFSASDRESLPQEVGFATILYNLVSEVSRVQPDVVKWSDDGKSFHVNAQSPELNAILDAYFKHNDHRLLERQINSYGFKESGNGFYFHELFVQGHPEYCEQIDKAYRAKRHLIDHKRSLRTKGSMKGTLQDGTGAELSGLRQMDPPEKQVATVSEEYGGDSKSNNSEEDVEASYDSDLSTYVTLEGSVIIHVDVDGGQWENEIDEDTSENEPNDEVAEVKDLPVDEMPSPPPESEFKILQRVYAADKDGLLYEAVIRRQLYGPQYHQQVEMGLVSSMEEAESLLKRAEEEPRPMWHYFVHYNNWNVNFDRWVPEYNVYEKEEKVKEFAARLMMEHKAIKQEMKTKKNGKQSINGPKFLREWKDRLVKVTKEMNFQHRDMHLNVKSEVSDDLNLMISERSQHDVVKACEDTAKGREINWTKAALQLERNLRDKGLSKKRNSTQANVVPLPFALKRIMVETWEIVTRCGMLPNLPSPISVRQALNMYLISKNVTVSDSACTTEGTTLNLPNEPPQDVDSDSPEQHWIDMTNGIVMLFDEALPAHLLYREEVPQLRAIDGIPDYSIKSYSQIYGCEHLLRLFVRLPSMLADEMDDVEVRPILGKVNDLVRFLHKNQGILFNQSHRKLNEMERREQKKVMNSKAKQRRTTAGAVEDNQTPTRKKTRKNPMAENI